MSGRLRAGDESVLGEVWETYGPALARWLLRSYRPALQPCDIEDALILALEQMWERRTTFDAGKGAVESWFVATVVNAVRDILRARQARVHHCGPLVDPAALDRAIPAHRQEVDKADAAVSTQLAELLRDVRTILGELPETQQSILRADAESPDGTASTRELADELGLSESTVRVYRMRGLRTLRQRIAESSERASERQTDTTDNCVSDQMM